MTLPLYRQDTPPEFANDGHRGLWYERFFDRYDANWSVPEDGKSGWVRDNAKPTGERAALEAATIRHLALITALQGRGGVFATDWHFATGLGLPHPVENGLAWHPTLGVPYLAGSGVKGLVKAWVEIWDESLSDEQRQTRLQNWFGTPEQAGRFLFFDALPIEPVTLSADVMTPHMGKWYEQGGEITDWRRQPERIPADWHAPVPVPFLVVKKAKLLFGIAPRQLAFADELPAIFAALKQALAWLGAGAKTAAGYGLMQFDEHADADLRERIEQERQRQRKAAEDKRREAERKAELESMEPFERKLVELAEARPDKGQSEIVYLIGLMKQDHWQGAEQQRVARWLAQRMQEAGEWKPETNKKNASGDKKHQRTLLVMGWLKDA